MAHTDPMTWRAKEQRWTKWYKGKIYNVSPRKLVKEGLLEKDTPPTKEATRTAMRKWWKQAQIVIDAEPQEAEPQPLERVYLSGVNMAVNYDEDGTAKKQSQIRLRVKRKLTNPGDVLTEPKGDLAEHVGKLITQGEQRMKNMQAETPADQTIGASVQAFLDFKRSQAEAGERTIDRVDCLRVHLDHFLRWTGADRAVESIGEQTVDTYYQHVLAECRKGTLSRYYARDLFASFRQFARWLASRRRITMPYNLNSREYGFKLHAKIRTFTDEEVKVLLKAATERTRLYLLLMLNTGGTQIDLAELSKNALDLDRGQLTRKRFKTEDHENVPVVVYPLWPETLKLLRSHLNKDNKLVNRHGEPLALVSTDGKPLLVKGHNAKGQLTKTDAIRSAFNRLLRKLKSEGTEIDGSLKLLRKTASSKLEAHPTYGRYVVHFLGQSPDSIASRHYITPDSQQFAAAVKWLREFWL